MEKEWKEKLLPEIKKPYMQSLRAFLDSEIHEGKTIFPPKEQIFEAFGLTEFAKVKIVIVGQDPYHGQGQAHGLSFSVQKGVRPPPSLNNIYKELKEDLGCNIPNHGYLAPWAKQGVLLLNSILTVRKKEPKSHHNKGWETFTDFVIQLLIQRKDPIVFMLWGKLAQEKCPGDLLKNSAHLLLKAPHPSPYSAHYGFLGCRHFSKANDFLKSVGKEAIDWQL